VLKVLFAVFSTYERHGWVHPSIPEFFEILRLRNDIAFRVVPVHNFNPAAAGRNVFCKQNKFSESDWICKIDNDMLIHEKVIDLVKNAPADADIIGAHYYMWTQGTLDLKLCWGMTDEEAAKPPGWKELTKCGTGVIFIRPRVFQEMEYPYFTYTYDQDGQLVSSEDIQFTLRARAQGFKIYGDDRIRVGHFHSVELGSMWDWYQKVVDNLTQPSVTSPQKDAERSSAAAPTDGVPATA